MLNKTVYTLMTNGDYAGALLLLNNNELSDVDKYNKAYCFYVSSNYNDCLELLKTSVNKIDNIIEMNNFSLDNITMKLVSTLTKPLPLLSEVVEENALYASIHIKWLFAHCLQKCGVANRADLIIEQLKKYKLNSGGENYVEIR